LYWRRLRNNYLHTFTYQPSTPPNVRAVHIGFNANLGHVARIAVEDPV
jgi:hypothetical protein